MTWYTVALFAHIVGVVTLFVTMALQWLVTLRLRRADSIAQIREWRAIARGVGRLAPLTGVLILGAGIYMTVLSWSILTTWIDVSIAAIVVMLILGMGVARQRLKAILRAAAQASGDVIDARMRARLEDPALWISMQMAVAVALGIVFMMTTKPDLAVSIAVVIVSLALGAFVGMLTMRPRHMAQSTAPSVKEASAK